MMTPFRILSLAVAGLLTATLANAQRLDAVVVDKSLTVDVNANHTYTLNAHSEVRLLNEYAASLAYFGVQLNSDLTLESFSEVFTDASGRVLRRVKKSELQRTEYTHNLADDCYYLYLRTEPPTYPITVTIDYRLRASDNVLSFPSFIPQTDYCQQVEHASYQLTVPAGVELQWAARNTDCRPTDVTDAKGRRVLTFTMDHLAPIAKETYGQEADDLLPRVYFAPADFTYYGTRGSLGSWRELGQWVYALTLNRDLLDYEAQQRIHSMTDTCTSVRSRVAVLYDYLRRNTRYVSIQLGIGGYQPQTADHVWRNGFGDCKALTNFMKAMLACVGVPSKYTLISTEHRQLLDMPNFQQLDHVVLQVPVEGDTLWLECTNPEQPLGYVHEHIAGHQAVELSKSGGRVVTLPDYGDEQNSQQATVSVQLATDGSADLHIDDEYRMHRYWRGKVLEKLDKYDLPEAVNARYNLPQAELRSVSVTDRQHADGLPGAVVDVEAHSAKYASVSGQRMFVQASPLHKSYAPTLTMASRTNDIVIVQGYCMDDHVVISLPEGFGVESMPQPLRLEQPFGVFESTMEAAEGEVRVHNRLLMRRGQYAAALAADLKDFESRVAAQLRSRVVLRRQ